MSQECADPPAVDLILDRAEKISLQNMDFMDRLGLACENGLSRYVKRKMSDRYDGDCLLAAPKYLTADSIISYVLTPNRISAELSTDLVSYLRSIGVNPHKQWESPGPPVTYEEHERYGTTVAWNVDVVETTFTTFLDKIGKGKISTTQKGVLEVTKLLLSKLPNLDQPYPNFATDEKVTVRSAIMRYFPQSQVSWLLGSDSLRRNYETSA